MWVANVLMTSDTITHVVFSGATIDGITATETVTGVTAALATGRRTGIVTTDRTAVTASIFGAMVYA